MNSDPTNPEEPPLVLTKTPRGIFIQKDKTIWTLSAQKRSSYMTRWFLAFLVFMGGIGSGWLSELCRQVFEQETIVTTIGWSLLAGGSLLGCFWVVTQIWAKMAYHGQHVRIVLHAEKIYIEQYFAFSWRQQFQVYHQDQLATISVQPIYEAYKKSTSPEGQLGLQLQEKGEAVVSVQWGYYLPEEQLHYVASLLQEFYLHNQAKIFLSPMEDLSSHLLEE